MCGMLEDLVAAVGPTEGEPLVAHTDGGAAYMGRRWRETCERSHVTRSMSRKGRSPDNARAEGFFGTLKCDFFEARDWTGVGFEEFAAALNAHVEWYRSVKIKKSLGRRTIRKSREELCYAT